MALPFPKSVIRNLKVLILWTPDKYIQKQAKNGLKITGMTIEKKARSLRRFAPRDDRRGSLR